MQPQFNTLDDDIGLEVVDPIEGQRFVFHTSEDVTPTASGTEEFFYPVSSACEITTTELRLGHPVATMVHDAVTGEFRRELGNPDRASFRGGEYLVGLSAVVKLYVRIGAEFDIETRPAYTSLRFGEPTRVQIGARSYHSSPNATVTVPDDPEGLMRAVSTFGSALKATSCERSWPTLRGHPPRLERGETLDVPAEISPPQTGVTIFVPDTYSDVYAVAPLAYYLGAEVRSGTPPRLTTETGFVYRLDTDRGVVEEAIRVLKQLFTFDCLVRTEGYNQSTLYERTLVESRLDRPFDFEALYEASLAEQVERYLSVPYATIEDAIPTWNRSVHLRPNEEGVELLPHVVNDLSVVRPTTTADSTEHVASREYRKKAMREFKRNTPGEERSSTHSTREYVPLPDVDAVEQAWVGEEVPERGTKLLERPFERELTKTEDSSFHVVVVCNDTEMLFEGERALERYGRNDVASFDVDYYTDVSTDELGRFLAIDADLFHYIGHIDDDGFECSDGTFDAASVRSTGATVALLNACRSYDQGMELIESGANAVIVSLGDVENQAAAEVGEKFAGLLNNGFGVGVALEVVIEHSSIGRQYITLGNPNASATQTKNTVPAVVEIRGDDPVEMRHCIYPRQGSQCQMGEIAVSSVIDDELYYLSPAEIVGTNVERAAIKERTSDTNLVIEDGEFTWY
ncbi:CHAT domain-containing protein [Halorussus halophilus]|uniref:hypothetical protein n=1 Tax=Halorussus halophilus TaxID=2650975 RepID=UPI00130169CC|nr:hypothetical protein [Halorussus halophilus]